MEYFVGCPLYDEGVGSKTSNFQIQRILERGSSISVALEDTNSGSSVTIVELE